MGAPAKDERGRRERQGDPVHVALAVFVAIGCAGSAPQASPAAAAGGQVGIATAPAMVPAPAPPATQSQLVDLLRSVRVAESTHNLIRNATFDGDASLPWMPSFTDPGRGEASVEGGAYCMQVTNAGRNEWDVQVRCREMTIQKGHQYAVRFKIASTAPTRALAKVAMSGPPYKAYWQTALDVTSAPSLVQSEFKMANADDPTAEFAVHMGGHGAAERPPFTVCIDDVILEDPEFKPQPAASRAPIANVLVNQVGYLPLLPKIAIVKSTADAPLAWALLDSNGATVVSGKTSVHGADEASGDRVHSADFSAYTKTGNRYVMSVGGESSHPFDIGSNVYRKLKYDALAYFYQTRSGIPIVMPYAGEPKWTHPAGHLGDKQVRCAPDAGCAYALDVSGGWYDAGDQGKYVVNGGFSVWMLLNQYERAMLLGSKIADFGDGKMNIPENHNGVPDLLDEARWELEFLMKMQVPEGEPLAGMAHHKIHDKAWTALATRPDEDSVERFLRPVSTAATLNLAASTSQAARIWKKIDAAFSARCLLSAERAWSAAVAHPAMYASSSDSVGGGAYEDDDVTDEFYWAASELFITTRKEIFRNALFQSRHHSQPLIVSGDGPPTALGWQRTAALGTISIALAPGLPAAETAVAREAIIDAANAFAELDRQAGYRVALKPGTSGLPWGSNSIVLNNAVIMGLAYDFTREPKYRDAVEDALSYILGRNPLDQSYVTGYGSRPLENPHHRFWAHQANSAFPGPPPGVLSGGPNSNLQDPYIKGAGLRGCAPMKCFIDHIESYSTNEEAINWNAVLAWVAAFLDERAAKP
jgi:endoglucanase